MLFSEYVEELRKIYKAYGGRLLEGGRDPAETTFGPHYFTDAGKINVTGWILRVLRWAC